MVSEGYKNLGLSDEVFVLILVLVEDGLGDGVECAVSIKALWS